MSGMKLDATNSDKDSAQASLDRWLTFDAETAAQYELEQGAARARHLQRTILIGLILYNMFNFTGMLLMPDIMWPSVVLRLLVVTPFSIGLAYLVFHLPAQVREAVVTVGMINAYAIPVFLFWWSSHPLAGYSFGEFGLTLVFGNMLLALRFRQAIVFTLSAFGITLIGLLMHEGLTPALLTAFTLQIVTASVFTLYGNYLIERRRCTDYVVARTALLRAQKAEHSQRHLTEISRTDALTGLPNRRHLDETLAGWLAADGAVAVLMIDIDHFKAYNDTLGHPTGDECLRKVAQVFLQHADPPDSFCARFGGEEFTFVVRDVDELKAARLARRLVDTIEGLAIPHPGRPDSLAVVTISIGVAIAPAGQTLPKDSVLRRADTALYHAKRKGRNCYVIGDTRDDEAAFMA